MHLAGKLVWNCGSRIMVHLWSQMLETNAGSIMHWNWPHLLDICAAIPIAILRAFLWFQLHKWSGWVDKSIKPPVILMWGSCTLMYLPSIYGTGRKLFSRRPCYYLHKQMFMCYILKKVKKYCVNLRVWRSLLIFTAPFSIFPQILFLQCTLIKYKL